VRSNGWNLDRGHETANGLTPAQTGRIKSGAAVYRRPALSIRSDLRAKNLPQLSRISGLETARSLTQQGVEYNSAVAATEIRQESA